MALAPARAADHVPAALNREEIHRLMVALATRAPEALETGLGESSFWLVAMALTTGLPARQIAHMQTTDLMFTSQGRFGIPNVMRDGHCALAMVHPVVAGIGLIDCVGRMVENGHRHQFPALIPSGRGWLLRCDVGRHAATLSQSVAACGGLPGRSARRCPLGQKEEKPT